MGFPQCGHLGRSAAGTSIAAPPSGAVSAPEASISKPCASSISRTAASLPKVS